MRDLRKGRTSIKDQAAARGEEPPVGVTVGELIVRGYDTDPEWDVEWIFDVNHKSPTGYSVGPKQPDPFALAH